MSDVQALNCSSCGATLKVPPRKRSFSLSVSPNSGIQAQGQDEGPRTVVCEHCGTTNTVPEEQPAPFFKVGGKMAGRDIVETHIGDNVSPEAAEAALAAVEAAHRQTQTAGGGRGIVPAKIVNRKLVEVYGVPFDPKNPRHKAIYDERKARGVVD